MALKQYPVLHEASGPKQADFPCPQLDWSSVSVLALGCQTQYSSVYPVDTIVQVSTNQNCWYNVTTLSTGSAIVGGAGSAYLPSTQLPIYVYVPGGGKIAAVWTTQSGFMSVVPALNIG